MKITILSVSIAAAFAYSARAQSLPAALSSKISAALTSYVCLMDAPEYHHYREYREFRKDGTWRATNKPAHGRWSIDGNKLVVDPTGAKNPEYYPLSPAVLEAGIGKLHLAGTGVGGDHITMDSTDQEPKSAAQSTPANSTYFGTGYPRN